MTTAKGFMKLNDDELKWLEGRVGLIDVQKGCPVQCLTCGVDAPKYSGNMPWKDFMALIESIATVKRTKNIDLITSESFGLFWSSDPVYYRSMDGYLERTLYDIVETAWYYVDHSPVITTAGWRKGDNYMERAMSRLADSAIKEDICDSLTYSIKTVSKKVYDEYSKFLLAKSNDGNIGQLYFSSALNKEFIEKSRYTANITDNMKTLAPLGKNVIYDLQCVSDNDIRKKSFQSKYNVYSVLFSDECVESIYWYALSNSSVSNNNHRHGYRAFSGIGTALSIGIEKSRSLKRHQEAINRIKIENTFSDRIKNAWFDTFHKVDEPYTAALDAQGVLQIYSGEHTSLSKIPMSKEHFLILAEKNRKSKDLYNRYMMLSNLQGKRILD